MKRDNVNYVLVGLVVLVALGVLLVTLALITGRTGATVPYYAYYENVTGLSRGAPVFYEGYRVGQVAEIEPDRSGPRTRYKVELAVREDWGIPEDSIARLVSSGLLADISIGIREGASEAMLEPGSEMQSAGAADIFLAMNDLASELTLLTRERLRPLVDTLSMRLDSISGTLDDSMPELVADARELMASLNRSAGALEQTLGPENREAIGQTLANVREITQELKQTQQRADQLVASLNDTVEENRPEVRRAIADLGHTVGAIAQRIEAITHHLESSSRNIDEFSREIRRNPNRLLFTPPPDEVE